MADIRLTPATARAAQPGDILNDHEVAGLHLRVTKTKAAWYLAYRTRDGVRRHPKLGNHPEMSLSAAREAAKAIKQQVAVGGDPSGDWQAKRDAPTVAELCERYLTQWAPLNKAASSVREDRLLIAAHVLPGLGKWRVADVTTDACDRFLADVMARKYVKPRKARGGKDGRGAVARPVKTTAPGARNRVRALLSKMMTLASTRWGMRADNPVRGTDLATEPGRRRVLAPHELEAVLRELRALAADKPRHAAGLLLMVLTGARVGEIAGATWAQYQPPALVLTEHKTKRAIGTKSVPLPAAALVVLDRLRADYGSEGRIFADCDLRREWDALRVRAGVPDVTRRDLRKTWASYALMSGKTLEMTGRIFGHTSTHTTHGYSWMLEEAKSEAVNDVAATMLRIGKVEPLDKP